jgi:UDP-glucose 4-epimerase
VSYADEYGKCFVTGAAGFIGSHLVERLLNEGCEVTGYDNLSSGRQEWIAPYLKNPHFTFIKGDILDTALLQRSVKGHSSVFHLAANGDIRAALLNPRLDLEQGVIATFNVIDAVRQNHAQYFFFTSSGSVFGLTSQMPTPETVAPLLPISMYAGSKMACEGIISAAANTFGFKARLYRLGNVVGRRMTRGVIYDFIYKLKKNPAELEILGDGEQEKNYILVEDVVDGMLFSLRAAKDQVCDLFHLGGADSLKVKIIAQLVIKEMGLKDVSIKYTGGKGGWPGDQPQAIFDISKLRALGWKPSCSSIEAVRTAVKRLL